MYYEKIHSFNVLVANVIAQSNGVKKDVSVHTVEKHLLFIETKRFDHIGI